MLEDRVPERAFTALYSINHSLALSSAITYSGWARKARKRTLQIALFCCCAHALVRAGSAESRAAWPSLVPVMERYLWPQPPAEMGAQNFKSVARRVANGRHVDSSRRRR